MFRIDPIFTTTKTGIPAVIEKVNPVARTDQIAGKIWSNEWLDVRWDENGIARNQTDSVNLDRNSQDLFDLFDSICPCK